MEHLRTTQRHHQHGAASLLVVIVLFFILALVTAYAGRSLIFEQRTSVNNQRAAQAFEAAESGLDFAIASLGGGRIDAACVSTNVVSPGTNTFRQRHLTQDPVTGIITTPGAQANLTPTCMLLSPPGGARCSCPAAPPNALIVPVGSLTPVFQLHFEAVAEPGVVRAVSRGCSSVGMECYAPVDPTKADAVAQVSVLLGLNSALATPPSAPLTVHNTLDLNNSALTVVNTDLPTRGITIDSGGPVLNSGSARLSSLPGTPGSTSVLASDPSLQALPDGDRMFVTLFGMDRDTYRTQPAAVQVACAGNCATQINDAISQNPGRVIWVQGPVTIEAALTRDPTDPPVMLVVQGDLTVLADLRLFGVLYLHGGGGSNTWTTTAGSTLIEGAVVAEGNLSVVGAPTIVFNPGVLRTINQTQGSLVRIPGSWRDFDAGT